MPDLPLVRFRFHGQGCRQEPTGHLVLSWKADKAEWRLVDWLRSNGQRNILTGDDPNNGARKFLEGLTEFIAEWHTAQQNAITAQSLRLGKFGPKEHLVQKGFRPQSASKQWWAYRGDVLREVTFIEQGVVTVIETLQQWLPSAALPVPPMLYPDPWR